MHSQKIMDCMVDRQEKRCAYEELLHKKKTQHHSVELLFFRRDEEAGESGKMSGLKYRIIQKKKQQLTDAAVNLRLG